MNKQSVSGIFEEKYPQTTQEFKNILDEMYETFCKKQRNYGPGNISVGTPLETEDDIKVAILQVFGLGRMIRFKDYYN